MTGLTVVLCAVLGLAVGSFLTVVVSRVPAGESVVRPRSRCPGCGAAVRPRDNVPVLSWLLLRGRCRGCGAAIGLRYPLLEASTAVLFAGIGARFGLHPELPAFLYLAGAGIALAAIDLETRRLPDAITLPSYLVGFAALVAVSAVDGSWHALLRALLAMCAGFAVYLALALLPGGGMGLGDVKLAGVIGLFVGWLGWGHWAVAVLGGFFLGGFAAVALLALRRAGRKSRIAFGPYMIAAALVATIFGDPIVRLWLGPR